MKPCTRSKILLSKTPGVEYATSVVGFNLLSFVQTTYSGFFFVTLKPWGEPKNRRSNLKRSSCA